MVKKQGADSKYIACEEKGGSTFQGEVIKPSKLLLPGWLGSKEACLEGEASRLDSLGLPCLASLLASSHSSTLTLTGSMSATLEASSWCRALKAIISSPSLNKLLQSRLPILRTCTTTPSNKVWHQGLCRHSRSETQSS